MMQCYAELRNIDSAKQIFEYALRGAPMDVTFDVS